MPRYRICPNCGGRIDTTQKARPHVCDKEVVMKAAIPYEKVRSLNGKRSGVVDINQARSKRRKPK